MAQLGGAASALVEVCVARGRYALPLRLIVRRKLPALWVAQQEMIAVASNV